MKHQPKHSSGEKGFTLVELLVVLVIIAVLAVVSALTYIGGLKKARTATRINDLKSIQSSLELYRQDNGQYPVAPPTMPYNGAYWIGLCYGEDVNGILKADNFVGKNLPTFPQDPAYKQGQECDSGNDYPNSVWYISNGKDYKVQYWHITDFNQSDYAAYPQLIDPTNDGGPIDYNYNYIDPTTNTQPYLTSCDGSGDGTNYDGWAIYSKGYRCAP